MRSLAERLQERVAATRHPAWAPVLFDLTRGDHRAEVEELVDTVPDLLVHDELATQVVGLMETRDPTGSKDARALASRVAGWLGDAPLEKGRWAWYPWSRRLVHVLPEAEFRELRTSRNRNKITLAEQDRLRQLRIGIVGLSIGSAAAITLTLEEVGGLLVLADFDHLELSNLNRLRAGVHALGVNKAVLAAREVYEINPYAAVEVWPQAVDAGNVDAFLCTGGRPLDLVYEECDDLHTKVLVRERAKHHRIPVLMETSDRGLMDVERFDREPERPIFHGLVRGVRAESLKGMTTFEKVPLVMQIHGRQTLSERMAASMVDIEATLKSWPQLASEVALGAGINVDTARRIALGQLNTSGRFYVDVHQIISDEAVRPIEAQPERAVEISAEAHHFDLPPLRSVRGDLTADDVRVLVAWATTAFSGGNCQPWTFAWQGGKLVLVHDVARSESFLDVDHRASYLAFGSVVENLVLAAPAMGLTARVSVFPDLRDPRRVADVELRPAQSPVDPLLRHVPDRVTNRRFDARRPFDPVHRDRMSAAAAEHGCRISWLEDPAALEAVAGVLGRADRVRMLSRAMHGDMMHEMRWTLEDVERTRDGIDVATLELTPSDLAGMRMISSWPVMRMVGMVGGGAGLERPTRKAIGGSSAVGLLTVDGVGAASFVRAGRALHRVWLTATANGVALQPMTTLTYLFHRLVHVGAVGLSEAEIRELRDLRRLYAELFPVQPDRGEPMLFRVGYAPPPTARSLRRPIDDVLRAV